MPSIRISTTVDSDIREYHLTTGVKYSDLLRIGYNAVVTGRADVPVRGNVYAELRDKDRRLRFFTEKTQELQEEIQQLKKELARRRER